MRIVVCLCRGTDGGIGPFEAAAYETALRVPNVENTEKYRNLFARYKACQKALEPIYNGWKI